MGYLIWAAGEYQNPQIRNILGSEHCIHSSSIKNPRKLEGDESVVIGGYESGVQIAFDLIKSGKKVTLINPYKIDDMGTSDPSKVLSPFTYDSKYNKIKDSPQYSEVLGEVNSVTKEENTYVIHLKDESPKLNEKTDEFFGQKNIYLSGPSVRHDNHIF